MCKKIEFYISYMTFYFLIGFCHALCGICSYINNTEYRGNIKKDINYIAKELGPQWMGHRFCCDDDIHQSQYNITTYNLEMKTLQKINESFHVLSQRSLRTATECLLTAGMLYAATDLIFNLFEIKRFNKCSKYDFMDSRTITTLYSNKTSIDGILRFDEKICSLDLRYCAKIENDKLVTRRTEDTLYCFKNINRAIKLNQDGSIELFSMDSRNSIWIRSPYITGTPPYHLTISNVGSIRVFDKNNNIVFESPDLKNPKTQYHEIY